MTADLRYRTGTASVETDGTVVTFSSALMLEHAMHGDHLSLNRLPSIEVGSVDGQLRLGIEPWNGPDLVNVPYVLWRDSILRATRGNVSVEMSKISTALRRSGYYYSVPDDAIAPDESDGDELQYAQQESTGKRWRKQDGVWVYKGIFAVFRLEGNWSAVTTYAQSVVVSRAGKLWLSRVDANLNHPPESSPTQWDVFLSGGDAYDVVSFDTDRPASGELLLKIVFTRNVTFYAGLGDSRAKAEASATASSVFAWKKNGTQFATLTFAAASSTGVWACPVETAFAAGDVLTAIAPNPRDATLSGVSATMSGYRS